MEIKNRRLTRFFSTLLVGFLTISFLFLSNRMNFFLFFKTDQKAYITFFVTFGVFLILLGIYLNIKTVKQFRTNKEISKTNHSDLGVYNKVRNPFYSSIFLISSGLLLTTINFLSLLVIGINWLFLTIVVIFLEESKVTHSSDSDYLKYMLRVNRLIPWFNQYFKIEKFNSKDEMYLEQAELFLNKELIAPVMGIYFPTFPRIFWFRKGFCFVTEEGIGFYSYDVFRGHYAQLIAYDKISSFVYARGTVGYSIRVYASNSSINLYFIQKGDFEKFVNTTKKRINF